MSAARMAATIGLACIGLAVPAKAASVSAPLPTLAADPPPPPSIWKGLYVGSEIFAGSISGHKGYVGGDAFAGYDRVFPNNVVLGVQASVGYAPYLSGSTFARGASFAAIDAKVGYLMGRWTPYLTSGLILTRANAGFGAVPSLSTSDSINTLLGGSGSLEAAPRIGAGVAYALTPNLSVAVGMQVGRGAAALFP